MGSTFNAVSTFLLLLLVVVVVVVVVMVEVASSDKVSLPNPLCFDPVKLQFISRHHEGIHCQCAIEYRHMPG